MERRRRRAQTQLAVPENARTRLQKSWNRSQETFLPAWRPAKAASISAYARCLPCPKDEQKSRHRVLQQRSRPAERCIIEIQSIYAAEIRIRVNVRSDLRTAQPKFSDTAFQLG